jgi:hypothetical protein
VGYPQKAPAKVSGIPAIFSGHFPGGKPEASAVISLGQISGTTVIPNEKNVIIKLKLKV